MPSAGRPTPTTRPPHLPHRHAAPTVPVRPDALHLPVDVARRALPGLLWRGPGVWSVGLRRATKHGRHRLRVPPLLCQVLPAPRPRQHVRAGGGGRLECAAAAAQHDGGHVSYQRRRPAPRQVGGVRRDRGSPSAVGLRRGLANLPIGLRPCRLPRPLRYAEPGSTPAGRAGDRPGLGAAGHVALPLARAQPALPVRRAAAAQSLIACPHHMPT
mmetsp:Transcript_43916/g.121624  ORF Transcript_43916/g.121624 Transcript_43916/m.121624 type:complete len:214 (-) Transcript_43916:690-1331(-)